MDERSDTAQTKFSNIEITDEELPILTAAMLDQWRARKAELDAILGAAGAEAVNLARKIKAAEFLVACQEQSHD